MASNISKAFKSAKKLAGNTIGKAVNFSQQHPVISSVGAALATPMGGIAPAATWLAGQFKGDTKKSKSSKSSYTPTDLSGYDLSDIYSGSGSGGGYGGGYGGYDVAKADISGLLAAYDQQAETARAAAESKYNNTRSDLLTSLKRFQEQNAKDVQTQKQNYLSEQSNLEGARAMADRQNRISAAARGLGGSGLQQLAQLQNLLGQSEEISQAAGKNQTAMDKLASLLRDYEEDNATKMRQNEEERTNTLNSIASQLASQKAAAIAQNEQNYVDALNQAAAQAAASRSYGGGGYSSAASDNALQGALAILQSNLNDDLTNLSGKTKSGVKKYMSDTYNTKSKNVSEAKSALKNYYNGVLYDLQGTYGFGANTVKKAQNNINNLLKNLK